MAQRGLHERVAGELSRALRVVRRPESALILCFLLVATGFLAGGMWQLILGLLGIVVLTVRGGLAER